MLLSNDLVIVTQGSEVAMPPNKNQRTARLAIFISTVLVDLVNIIFCLWYMIQSFTNGYEEHAWPARIAIPITFQCVLNVIRSTIKRIYLEGKSDNRNVLLSKICHCQDIALTIVFVIFSGVFLALLGKVIFKDGTSGAWLPVTCSVIVFINLTIRVFVQGTICFTSNESIIPIEANQMKEEEVEMNTEVTII